METVKTTTSGATIANNFVYVPLDLLELYPNNPRKDLGDIKSLAASIIGAGRVIKPLSGKETGGVYQVVDGQRRLAALNLIKEEGGHDDLLQSIPFEVLTGNTSEVDLAFLQITSNEGEPLKPLEIAEEVKRLSVDWDLKTEEIANKLGVSKVYVNELKRVADLPENVKSLINKGTVSATLIRQQMKAGTLDEFIAGIEKAPATEEGEALPSETISEKVTAKDVTVNSIKEFKRFAKAFTEIFPNEQLQNEYEFLTDVIHNNVTYEGFIEHFTDDKTRATAVREAATDTIKAPETVQPKRGKLKQLEMEVPEADVEPNGENLETVFSLPENSEKTEQVEMPATEEEPKVEIPATEPATEAKTKGSKGKGSKEKKAPVKAAKNGKSEKAAPAKKGTSRKIAFDKKANKATE